jgi:hypothetical protein
VALVGSSDDLGLVQSLVVYLELEGAVLAWAAGVTILSIAIQPYSFSTG